MCSYKCGGFRTKARLTETYRLEARFDGLRHFFLTEIAFRTYENQGILARYKCFLQELLIAFVAMADEFLPLEVLSDELVEVGHFIQHRLVGLQGLLDSRYQNLVDAVGLDNLAF